MASASSSRGPEEVENPKILTEILVPANQNHTLLSRKSIVGKLRSTKVQNVKAVKEIISKAWANHSKFSITELGENRFVFNFEKDSDVVDVLRKSPWFVMNHLMCLEYWESHTSCDGIDFNKSSFWMQIHNLPLGFMNVSNATTLLNKVGEILEVEDPIVEGKILRNFVRGRVRIKLAKPLPARVFDP